MEREVTFRVSRKSSRRLSCAGCRTIRNGSVSLQVQPTIEQTQGGRTKISRTFFYMDILGQAHALKYLTQGLQRDRLSPSLIFTGPDGVGKRSCAMELAKCFVCEQAAGAIGVAAAMRRVQRLPARIRMEPFRYFADR